MATTKNVVNDTKTTPVVDLQKGAEGAEGTKDGTEVSNEGEGEGEKPAEKPAEITSPALLEIRKKLDEAFTVLPTITDRMKQIEHLQSIYKLQGEEKAEQGNIARIEAEKVATEKRNARIAIFTNAEQLLIALVTGTFATEEEKAAAQLAYDAAANEVKNALLGNVAKIAAAGTGAVGDAKEGSTGAKIQALYAEMHGKGVSRTEAANTIKAMGYSRGTTDAEILKWEKKNGLKS